MKSTQRFLAGTVTWLALTAVSHAGDVRIDEIMYHPGLGEPGYAGYVAEDVHQEFVELLNRGADAVDLAGWRFSQGVSFTFPGVTLEPGQRLVVAADADTNRFRAAYQARYPGITNAAIVGGWTGTLGNNGEDLEIEDAAGNRQDIVRYASQGDWALRRQGDPYPGSTGWWLGWKWTSPADAGGRSLEMVNPALPGDEGQNWAASLSDGGTPGGPNSVAADDIAPLITDVLHRPAIPRSGNAVTITARLTDEGGTSNLSVLLYHRLDGAASFTGAPMADDGLHGDGAAGDGVFGAVLSPQPNRTIVEFYVRASDATAHARTWPAPTDESVTQGANAFYQVDDSEYLGRQAIFRLVIRAAEWSAWQNLMDAVSQGRRSDAQMNGTLIVGEGASADVRYLASIRNRGQGTRTARPHNMHVAIPNDHPWKGQTKLALNSRHVQSQVAGNAVCAFAGLPNAYGGPVQVRVNGVNLANATPVAGNINTYQFGSYYLFQLYDSDWASEHEPLDPKGNLYKGLWYLDWVQLTNPADLRYLGTNVASYRMVYSPSGPTESSGAYAKLSNVSEDDWSDLIHLTDVLNNTPDSNYIAEVSQVADIDEWLGYFAFNSLVGNMETCLATGTGDDYSSYRGILDSRVRLLNHDMDTTLGQGGTTPNYTRSVFKAADLAVLDRFLKHPDIAPRYFTVLKEMANTAFAPESFDPLMDQWLGDWVDTNTVQSMKGFVVTRRANVLSQIPQSLSVTSGLPRVSGYPHTTDTTVAVWGRADAILARAVRVNGSPSAWSAWQAAWTNASAPLNPGLNRLRVESLDSNGVAFATAAYDIWCERGVGTRTGGTIGSTTLWTAAAGPYIVTSSLTVASGGVLSVEPGTSVYLGSNVGVSIANGGRLLAEGTPDALIRFGAAPGTTARWSGITVNGANSSPETRFSWVHIESNGTTAIHSVGGSLLLDHVTFGTTDRPYLSLDGSSFVVRDCHFPSGTDYFELVHGTGGVRSDGQGLFLRNFFGRALSVSGDYNDVIDFSGGNRADGPILQFINNVFAGASDDHLDLDNADAWIEGNIFLHAHKNGSPDTSSAISGGNDTGQPSEITIVGNLIYDCDHVALVKQDNFFTIVNNTIVRQTHAGGLDTTGAVVCLQDNNMSEGAGVYLEGNIIHDAEQLTRDVEDAAITCTNNLMSLPWGGPGGGNAEGDPRFKHVPQMSETAFDTWAEAQVMRDWLGLESGSPAAATGPNGRDKGGGIPLGACVSGEPAGTTRLASATLTVGVNRKGNGIPVSGWPEGSGFVRYRWRLDGGAWSAGTSIETPIVLSGLANGPHQVEVVGQNDAGWYQDDVALGADAVITTSRTWTVDTSIAPRVRINEILADNRTVLANGETNPDLVELYNESSAPVDLSGMGLTDNPSKHYKFAFPNGTVIGSNGYLVVYADSETALPGTHLGFGLSKSGEAVYLYARSSEGGALLDSVTFGVQVPDVSIGRLDDGPWGLTTPTFGARNIVHPVGEPRRLRINEWLADGATVSADDYIELYNADALPVSMGGLFLTDNPVGWPDRHGIAPLSFIPGQGFSLFVADGQADAGPDHVGFALAADAGMIGLFDTDLRLIDHVVYGQQSTDVSQGRTPNGGPTIRIFDVPSPGGTNPGSGGGGTNIVETAYSLITFTNVWRYNQTENLDAVAWTTTNYSDSAWPSGRGMFYRETSFDFSPVYTNTLLSLGSPHRLTYYFRTAFAVTNTSEFSALRMTHVIDDGAVFYLNGQELTRFMMPQGAITYTTTATNHESEIVGPLDVPMTALKDGVNVMAVEVHQVSTDSSDVVMGLALDGVHIATNIAMPETGVQLNEIVACRPSPPAGYPPDPDWVEVFNSGTNDLDLADHGLTDDLTRPYRFVFPTGSVVRAGGHRLVLCTPDLPASATNTGFGLAASGGAVYLFSPAGDLLDSVHYGLQTEEYAIGRATDGAGMWVLTTPTPGGSNVVATMGETSALRVNEWMADPASGDDWFEICNTGALPVALGGLGLSPDPFNPQLSPIPALSFVGTGAHGFALFQADDAPEQGADHTRFKLTAAGGSVGIFAPAGQEIDTVMFGAQTAGVSQGRLPDAAALIEVFPESSSPGRSNWLPVSGLAVNEVLSHTDLPLEDAVEFANETASDLPVGGWYLSNSTEDLGKLRLPDGMVIPAHGFMVVYEYQFNGGGTTTPFTFNSAHGDEVWLSEADGAGRLTGRRIHEAFGAAANGVSFGRYRTSVGTDFVALSSRTFGAADPPPDVGTFRLGQGASNAPPRVGPVVISEIMYQPAPTGGVDNTLDEFVELANITGEPVPMYDPAAPTNTWSVDGDVRFAFPTGFSVAASGTVVLVSFDPVAEPAVLAAFRGLYSVPPEVPVLGPFDGQLGNTGGTLELLKPDPPQAAPHPDAGYVPRVRVEAIGFRSAPPWPAEASGTGWSIHRLLVSGYGNEPLNWYAGASTAGLFSSSPPADADADGLPDAWELLHFGSITAPEATPEADPDRDGFDNRTELALGTNPTDPESSLRAFLSDPLAGGGFAIRFLVITGHTYTVESADALIPPAWSRLTDVEAQPTSGVYQVVDPAVRPIRFYRIVTPKQP